MGWQQFAGSIICYASFSFLAIGVGLMWMMFTPKVVWVYAEIQGSFVVRTARLQVYWVLLPLVSVSMWI